MEKTGKEVFALIMRKALCQAIIKQDEQLFKQAQKDAEAVRTALDDMRQTKNYTLWDKHMALYKEYISTMQDINAKIDYLKAESHKCDEKVKQMLVKEGKK